MIHFLLTRFNLKLWPRDKRGETIDRDSWLEERMQLFRRYCYPSVRRQSCKNFRWILLLDDTTPKWAETELESLWHECPQMEVLNVPVAYSTRYAALFRNFVASHSTGEDKVLTTYLDNDDAIAVDFVENVQKAALGCNPGTVLTFPRGYQYFTQLNIATCIRYPNNHFITYIESSDSIRTVYGLGSHYTLKEGKGVKIKKLTGDAWVEVVHNDNVDNDVKMTLRTSLVTKPDEFQNKFGDNFEMDEAARDIYLAQWMPRAIGQFRRRLNLKRHPRDWWGE